MYFLVSENCEVWVNRNECISRDDTGGLHSAGNLSFRGTHPRAFTPAMLVTRWFAAENHLFSWSLRVFCLLLLSFVKRGKYLPEELVVSINEKKWYETFFFMLNRVLLKIIYLKRNRKMNKVVLKWENLISQNETAKGAAAPGLVIQGTDDLIKDYCFCLAVFRILTFDLKCVLPREQIGGCQRRGLGAGGNGWR